MLSLNNIKTRVGRKLNSVNISPPVVNCQNLNCIVLIIIFSNHHFSFLWSFHENFNIDMDLANN